MPKMDLQQTSLVNFDQNPAMSQYVQAAQNPLQAFQLPLQQFQGQGQIQLQGQQQLPLLQLGQGQFLLNQSQLLQQLGQGQGHALQIAGQGQNLQLPGQAGQQQTLQLSALQQGQALQSLQLQGQSGQQIQLQGQNNQAIQLQSPNGQSIQLQGHNAQPIQLQGQNGQTIQIHGQNGQTLQIQGQNGQAIQLQGQNGQTIQLQNQNGQQIQVQAPSGQTLTLPGQQALQIQGQHIQLPTQAAAAQTFQLQNQINQALQMQAGQQFQAVQFPGQQPQMLSLQGQPMQVVHVQGPNGQITQQVVPVMVGADQLGGLVNPFQQQMFLQAQNQSPMVGQFVQTESGLVWQPTGVFGSTEANNQVLQLQQAANMANAGQTSEANQPEATAVSVGETGAEQDNTESQSAAAVSGDSLSSVPGSTNTTTTSSSQPLARIQIAAEDPDDSDTRPLYVNAKQYNRILKRRAARAKLESTGKIVRKRKKYLHESRHKHACQRIRGNGGRFFSVKVEPEGEFGLKEETDSPHQMGLNEQSPHSVEDSPSPPNRQLEVDESPSISLNNGHI